MLSGPLLRLGYSFVSVHQISDPFDLSLENSDVWDWYLVRSTVGGERNDKEGWIGL